jgi:hypothetical protein
LVTTPGVDNTLDAPIVIFVQNAISVRVGVASIPQAVSVTVSLL